MIDYTFFMFVSIMGALFGAILGYTLISHRWGTVITIIFTLLCALFAGGFTGILIDNTYSRQTISCEPVNFTILATFQQHTFFGEDLTAKLDNGYIVHYNDPYLWKSVKPGDVYQATIFKFQSFRKGNVSGYIYDRADIPVECQVDGMHSAYKL